jgi:predicted CXXCH cytochrome family protein
MLNVPRLKNWRVLLICLAALVSGCKATPPGKLETYTMTRAKRWLLVPNSHKGNPVASTPENISFGKESFSRYCVSCHGLDAENDGVAFASHLSPPVPSLASVDVQTYSDGQLKWIIDNGLWPSGMPGSKGILTEQQIWSIVLYVRQLKQSPSGATTEVVPTTLPQSATYVGSQACEHCHEDIYQRWKKTPMANVVRDPHEHPDAILPDLSKQDPLVKFTKDDVTLVYGSKWKQRYFTKIGNDYFPEPAQWDVTHQVWRPYFVAPGTDWWGSLYPPDNMKRPTGPTCDGCHSVNYNVHDHTVTEWNVGCERCHGPGSEHVKHPSLAVLNPGKMDFVRGNDTCIQCHSQGRPLTNPIEGRYYDWPVGYGVGKNLSDFWQLEDHKLGETTFTHFADGTGHKNRMQGNDFVQSVMYRRGVTCFTCHDAHGTSNYAELRKPANVICMDCHAPGGLNGPRASTLEEHTHHKAGSAGSECVACHMPEIQMTIADVKVHAHTFQFISPAMTDKYKIPNPCTSCHADESTQWALAQMKEWKSTSPWRVLQ